MNDQKILVTSRSFAKGDDAPLRLLESKGYRVVRYPAEAESLNDWLKREIVDADGAVAGLEPYPAELIESCTRLKVISRYGVGYDKVDLDAARSRNIAVTNTPGANSESVADMAFALMLSCARFIPHLDACIRRSEHKPAVGHGLWGKTIGIIGTGSIGKGVARRAAGFNMRILCSDVYPDNAFAQQVGATYTDLDTMLAEADFISIHAPYTEETHNMFDKAAFARMKSTAVLVNTARGGIIDEDALYEALSEGQIAAAGLDATVVEPPYGSALTQLYNVILTPHMAANTYDAILNMGMMASQNLIDVLETGSSRFCVNGVKSAI